MRSISILVIVGLSFSARGQFNQKDVNSPLNVEINKYKQVKTRGNILIGASGILTVIGISKLASLDQGNMQFNAVLIGVAGLAILGTGKQFSSKGAKKQH